MKKKVLTVLLTGAMVASMAAGATVVSAEDNDNTLTVWAWDQNFNIKSMQIAADQYAADHEGFSVDIIETSSDDCQTKLTTAANAGDYSTLPDIVLMQDNSYQKFLKAYPDAFTDLKDMRFPLLQGTGIPCKDSFSALHPLQAWQPDGFSPLYKSDSGIQTS